MRASVRELPVEYRDRLDNVEFVVERAPSRRDRQRLRLGNSTLYGHYEGVPLTRRDSSYDFVVPDRITVYWGPLLRDFPDDASLRREVQNTVYHEIAHYFGLEEDDLHSSRVQ